MATLRFLLLFTLAVAFGLVRATVSTMRYVRCVIAFLADPEPEPGLRFGLLTLSMIWSICSVRPGWRASLYDLVGLTLSARGGSKSNSGTRSGMFRHLWPNLANMSGSRSSKETYSRRGSESPRRN